jgi:hypothetical protein
MKGQNRATTLTLFVTVVFMAALPEPARAIPGVKQVHCGTPGHTIAKALTKAEPGDTFLVSGVCREKVTLTTDRITLDGQGSAILDGGGGAPTQFNAGILIDGVQGVVIKGFTIQNSSGEGILGLRGAAFDVQGTTVQDNAGSGILVGDHSVATLTDCVMRRNSLGLDVFNASSVVLKGLITANNNTVFGGINAFGQSVIEIRGATVQVNDNSSFGLVVGGSQLVIFAFAESQSSTLTAKGNGASGIVVLTGSLEVYPPQLPNNGAATITSANNGTDGIALFNGFLVSPFGTARFVVENNKVGMNFGQGSGATIVGGLMVQNNATVGLLADSADSLTLTSIPANPSAILGNDRDVDVRFGTRITVAGVAIGTMVCDGTVLSRGSTTCP